MAWKTQLRLPEGYQYERKADDCGKGSHMVGAEEKERHEGKGELCPPCGAQQREERRTQCLPVCVGLL